MSYLCYSCGYQSKYKANLRAHMKTHTGEIPYEYKTLDRWSTAAAADLRSHMMSHFEDKPYGIGSFDFGGERVGDFGKRYHTGKKPEKCGSCDYKTDRAGDLRAHMKTHSGEDEQECELCDNSGGSKTHARTHTDENARRSCSCSCNGTASLMSSMKNQIVENRSCGMCDYSSNGLSSNHLKRHVTTLVKRLLKGYIGEKHCACELCDCSSNQTEKLGTLVRTHNGRKPLASGSCDFRCSTALRTHRRTQCDEDPYAFGLCDYRRNHAGGLSTHRRTLTKQKPDDCKLCEYESSASSRGSSEYIRIRAGDFKKRAKTSSKKKPYKGWPFDHTFNPNGQFNPHLMPTYPYDGFPSYVWSPSAGDTKMKTRTKIHSGDPLPYAVVLVTGDPSW